MKQFSNNTILIKSLGEPDKRFDIAIGDSPAAAVELKVSGGTAEEIDTGGNLVAGSYVNINLRLCTLSGQAFLFKTRTLGYYSDKLIYQVRKNEK